MVILESDHTRRELDDLLTRLRPFEQQHRMQSGDFHVRFHAGELGDEAKFFEWSALYDMAGVLRQRLHHLESVAE
ncbi:MAG: hypothetical protein AB1345_11865 [Chloroflexota bacterium]